MSTRRRSRQRSPLKRFLVLFVIILLLGALGYLVWFSPALDIQSVEVVGGELVPDVEFDSLKGHSILFFKLEIDLDVNPKVAAYKVEKDYINRSLKIEIGGRERFVIWCVGEEGSKCFWVDSEGVAFSNAPNLKGPLVFRLVRDVSDRGIGIGDTVLEPAFFENLKKAFKFLDDTGISANELKIENLKFREVIAHTSSGPDILFSLEQDPAFGISVVKSLKENSEWNILNYLDLRVEGRAYYSQ